MSRRTMVVALALSTAVLALPGGLAAAAPGADEPRAVPRGSDPPVAPGSDRQGDRDGNGISDDFEPRLRSADAGERVDVVVTGLRSLRAQRRVGAFRVSHELPIIGGFSATMTAAQARALSRAPGLRRIERDGRMSTLDDATDRDFGAAAARAATPGLDGSGVGICVIDTGVDPAHEQVAPRTVRFVDYVNSRSTAYDDHGHGTHVAAIAAGDGDGGAQAALFGGVAPAADLYAAKVLSSSGSGANSDVVAGVQWCHDQPGVDVISMSLGGGGGDGTDAVSLAVDNAVAGGDVAVVAAGNSGDRPGTVNAPGVARGAITVGAVAEHSAPPGTARHDDGIWLAAFSSRGPTSDGRVKPDVTGPGVTVTAAQAGTTAGYVTYSGTSMATPYVAGAVALAREAAPSATPDDLRTALTGTAVDVGPAGADNDWGAGLLDVLAFVDAAASATEVRAHAFPALARVTGDVPDGGFVDIPVEVPEAGLGVPLAITMTADGEAVCYWGCLIVEWSPDLDLELRDPSGAVVATSQCALSGLSCGVGRQETIGITPQTAGTYTLRVYAFTGSPNNGEGGPFAVDISSGPLSEGAPSEPPPSDPPPEEPPPEEPPAEPNVTPVAAAGADQTVNAKKKTGEATFALDGSASSDSDGQIVSHVWTEGGTQVGSGATVQLTRGLGSHTFTLTVTDDDGATDSDDVTVTVRLPGRG